MNNFVTEKESKGYFFFLVVAFFLAAFFLAGIDRHPLT
jgi:preprotein translocase subunit SecE